MPELVNVGVFKDQLNISRFRVLKKIFSDYEHRLVVHPVTTKKQETDKCLPQIEALSHKNGIENAEIRATINFKNELNLYSLMTVYSSFNLHLRRGHFNMDDNWR